jgi:hypothetical protein
LNSGSEIHGFVGGELAGEFHDPLAVAGLDSGDFDRRLGGRGRGEDYEGDSQP